MSIFKFGYMLGALIIAGVGSVFLLLGNSSINNYYAKLDNRPPEVRMALWLSPQAEVMADLSFSAGLPARTVTMEKFKQRVGDHPYQVYHEQKWTEGFIPSSSKYSYFGAVEYHAMVKLNDGSNAYLIAFQPIPYRPTEYYGWSYTTEFDVRRNEFVSRATTLDDSNKKDGWALRVLAALCFLISAVCFFCQFMPETKIA